MADKACLLIAKERAGDLFDDKELIELFNRAAEMKQKQIDAGHTDDLFNRVNEAIKQEAAREKRKANAQKVRIQQEVLNVKDKTAAIKERIADGQSVKGAILSLFHGSIKGIRNGRVSIERQKAAYSSKFIGGILGAIAKDRPHLMKLLRDPSFDEAVTRELMETRPGGKPGITQNVDARYVADLFNKQLMLSRITVNKFGAAIQDSIGYVGPEAHNDVKIIHNEKKWLETMFNGTLDLEASFPGLNPTSHKKEIMKILREGYQQIVTGNNNAFGTVLGSRIDEPPITSQFVFASADKAIEYQKEFGYTSTIASIFNTLDSRAHDSALMESLGHNPRRTLNRILTTLRNEIEEGGGTIEDTRDLHVDLYDTALNLATGQVNHIQNHTIAKLGSELRAVTQMSLLGKALLAAMPADTALIASAAMFRGDSFFKGFMSAIFKSMDGLTPAERIHAAGLYAEGFDGLIGHLSRGALAEDGRVGMFSKMSDTYFKANGLTPWTDTRRAISARLIASHLGENAGKQFDELHWRLQNVLEQNGIDMAQWEDIRSLVHTAENGKKYIYPEGFEKLTHLSKTERDKLELNLRGYLADEVSMGMLEADNAGRYMSLMGSARRGDMPGEVLRGITQFTAFPVVFGQRVLGRAIMGVQGKTTAERMMKNTPHMGMMLASMLAAGYASWALKEISAGRTPPIPDEDNYMEFALKIFESSGVAGYYGSMVTDAIAHGGRTPGLGPAGDTIASELGAVGNLLNGDVGKFNVKTYDNILNNTPYMNLFYFRPVLDVLFLNSIDDIMHPQRAERAASTAEKYNQERIWGRTL